MRRSANRQCWNATREPAERNLAVKRDDVLAIERQTEELTDAIFVRPGMTRTSLQWRPDFRPNLADGWNDKGEPREHDERSNVRVAGTMDATINDSAKFIAALVRGDGLSMNARAEMVRPSLHIGTAHQFPNFAPYLPKAEQRSDLAVGWG
jgi:hypothetical protein